MDTTSPLDQALRATGERLARRGQRAAMVVVGGTALNLLRVVERATRDVQKVLGASGSPVHASVIRWQRGVAQYAVGHRALVREAVTAGRTHKIVLAGADYRGPGVNDLCADADLVVDEVRAW